MTDAEEPHGHMIDQAKLPQHYPTHAMAPEFWERLGRTVATFGFLEEVLGKAIFALTTTKDLPDDPEALAQEYNKWIGTFERALTDQLRGLIDSFGKAIRNNGNATIINPDELLSHMMGAAIIRNTLCHGSWRTPDADGRVVPFFVNRKLEVWDVAIDAAYLDRVRKATLEMACGVIDTVTSMGLQFPGSGGPGKPVWPV